MSAVNNRSSWVRLEKFSITVASGSNRLYANGRQQVKLRVEIEAWDAARKPVRLSEREISSIRLIQYHGGEEIHFNSRRFFLSLNGDRLWTSTTMHDEQYRYYPSQGRADLLDVGGTLSSNASSRQATTYQDFYVQSIADTTLRVAAKITRDDGEVFTTLGRTAGSVTLVPVDIPKYGPEDYAFNPVTIVEQGSVVYDYIPFSLNSTHGNVEFRSFHMGSSVARYTQTTNNRTIGVFTGFVRPGESHIGYYSSAPTAPREIQQGYVLPGRPVIVVVRGTNVDLNTAPRPRSSAIASAVDMYGNPHEVTLLFKASEGDDRALVLY